MREGTEAGTRQLRRRAVRGGGYCMPPVWLQAVLRGVDLPQTREAFTGFRVFRIAA